MINFVKKNMMFFVLLLTIILPLNAGCSKLFKRPQENQKKQTQEQKKSPPKTLTAMEKITEDMVKQIQETKEKQKKVILDKEESKLPSIDWQKLQKNVEKLQSSWSDYVNNARKDGASNELIKDYESQLDIVTTKVMDRQEDSLLESANDLNQYYPKFLNLYKHQAPPNIKEMKYHILNIIIDGENGQWSQSRESIEKMKLAWEIAKSRMEKPDQNINKKVQASIDSFSRSVQQKNIHLVKIKGDILIKNLEKIK